MQEDRHATEVRIEAADPHDPAAIAAVARYLTELADRLDHNGPPPDDMSTWGLDALAPPHGRMLLARSGDRVVGCGGVQVIDDAFAPGRVAEIKRMWVDPDQRGTGLGRRLLAALEAAAVSLGHRTVRLDTDSRLIVAAAMYERAGYVPVPPYNDNPYADRWFEKRL